MHRPDGASTGSRWLLSFVNEFRFEFHLCLERLLDSAPRRAHSVPTRPPSTIFACIHTHCLFEDLQHTEHGTRVTAVHLALTH